MIVRKTVRPPMEEKTWEDFKILAIRRKKSIDGLVSELIYREVSDSAFEVATEPEPK